MYQPIKYSSPREVGREIQKLNSKKAPGYDLINVKVLKELPKKEVVTITQIYAIIRTQYFPIQWKYAKIILYKPDKPPNELTFYRPISLLSVLSKLFEKLLLKRIKPFLKENNIISQHQFGFKEQHSTIQQIHLVINIIEKSLRTQDIFVSLCGHKPSF